MLTAARALVARVRAMPVCQRGATAIEYAMIAAGIAVVISVAVFTVGNNLITSWYNVIVAAFH
jgi:Flp pilus assembly pilin Flp